MLLQSTAEAPDMGKYRKHQTRITRSARYGKIVVMKCFYGMINKEIFKMKNVGRSHQRCVCTLEEVTVCISEEVTVCTSEEAADTSIAILGGRLWAN